MPEERQQNTVIIFCNSFILGVSFKVNYNIFIESISKFLFCSGKH